MSLLTLIPIALLTAGAVTVMIGLAARHPKRRRKSSGDGGDGMTFPAHTGGDPGSDGDGDGGGDGGD